MTTLAPQPRTEYREPPAVARLRAAFASGASADELRAALREARDASMTPYQRAMSGELIGEVAKHLLFGGRA
ncbi:hypothetical protein Dgeo_3078 (plasmid) [Deinococcus geothermalis DSM 11300]|uniref:Uncharacterized protein n=1 Tax=Deinococcus geothermalis (strain DSM 11300 / CIP 105573 / AG-3a) TaxID=319795 RepID=A8ZRL0_DEIGD|nr:hypothetical protein [Deinococcus geothermalis]ABW35119.1 hypothetical protein Dgeo_3078 [Deinococcus geothermalis DSM 11300]